MPGNDRFLARRWPTPSAIAPEARQTVHSRRSPEVNFGAFLQTCGARRFDGVGQVLEPMGSTRPEDRGQSCEECRGK